tara:strand:- start:220 stop:894 length:675 start_codon:yes stop_codon:yes gene_type:complete
MKEILEKYTLGNLQKMVKKSNIVGYSKYGKEGLIKEMLKPEHRANFRYLRNLKHDTKERRERTMSVVADRRQEPKLRPRKKEDKPKKPFIINITEDKEKGKKQKDYNVKTEKIKEEKKALKVPKRMIKVSKKQIDLFNVPRKEKKDRKDKEIKEQRSKTADLFNIPSKERKEIKKRRDKEIKAQRVKTANLFSIPSKERKTKAEELRKQRNRTSHLFNIPNKFK